ncbi:MAG: ImmA/IrrE family metallo-endopeptidase [Actinomycetota bacterium]|nr:ImmA/IrrE family metallo-endopeptidase [Actinomycetota bacterium]
MEKFIEKRAKTILRAADIKAAPVDLERVLAYLRLHHERPWHLSSDVWEGLTRPKRGRTRLTGQERRITSRERWRLAHEIGHHVIHAGAPVGREAGQWQKNEIEHEADLFAAEILMPASLVEKAAKAVEKDHHTIDVEDMARSFKVGRQEMEKRLRQLGLLRGEILGRM